jgi:phage terminase large subunit
MRMTNQQIEHIRIPYKFDPRDYQLPFLDAMDAGYKRAVLVWHRRAGKDKVCLNYMIKEMFNRPGAYYYFFPTYKQGKKILWQGKDGAGFPFMGHFPDVRILRKNDTELLIEIWTGETEKEGKTSIFQIIGTEDIDAVMGTNPVGCVFSEFSLQDPSAWNYVRPILAENKGWAVFNGTPRGENHFKDLWELSKRNKKRWYGQLLTVKDTKAISEAELRIEKEEIRRAMGDDGLYNQEYLCSFELPVQGSYYGKWMTQAEKEERICGLAWEPKLLVDTWWDIGVNDINAIWFTQMTGNQVRVIDYYQNSGEGLQFYIKVLKEKPYTYGIHHGPHDLAVRSWTGGKSRWEIARDMGFRFEVGKKEGFEDGVEAVRSILPRCIFDEKKCEKGINALKSYHKVYDESTKIYKNKPYHDWTSNPCDAFRYLAMGVKDKLSVKIKKKISRMSHFAFRRLANPLTGM